MVSETPPEVIGLSNSDETCAHGRLLTKRCWRCTVAQQLFTEESS